jgi:hypothetical protein
MKGSNTGNDPGSYGTMGIPSPSNNPGARAYGAATWVDSNGDLWMFGGNGVSPTWSGMLADVWKYTIATNEWTWMQGNPGDYSNFGTLQVPNATNSPGQREECTANWIDANGNLWFYGDCVTALVQQMGTICGCLIQEQTSGHGWQAAFQPTCSLFMELKMFLIRQTIPVAE